MLLLSDEDEQDEDDLLDDEHSPTDMSVDLFLKFRKSMNLSSLSLELLDSFPPLAMDGSSELLSDCIEVVEFIGDVPCSTSNRGKIATSCS
jgi:hypothetical protein